MTTTGSGGRQKISACDGVTTQFPCPHFVAGTDLQVWLLDNAFQSPITGTRLIEGLDYTLSGNGRTGAGEVETLTVYPAGKFLCRRRATGREQLVDLRPNEGFSAEALELSLDRLALIAEELDQDVRDSANGPDAVTLRNDLIEPVGPLLQQITQAAATKHFAHDGAKINRLARIFAGDAVRNTGEDVVAQADWLTQQQLAVGRFFGFQQFSHSVILTDHKYACNALVVASRTSTFDYAGNAIGLLSVAVNDNTAYGCGAYGFYSEAYQMVGATGPAYPAEFDIINFKGLGPAVGSFSQASSQTGGIQLASGGDLTGVYDASFALALRNNRARFRVGLVIGNDALTGANGDGVGTAPAIQMARGHTIEWQTAGGAGGIGLTVAQITALGVATAAGGTKMIFDEGFVRFNNFASGKGMFSVGHVANGVNWLRASNAISGQPASISAQSNDDVNVGIAWIPKGNAHVSVPIANVPNFANDAAAAAGGVLVNEFYRNGSVLMIRAA